MVHGHAVIFIQETVVSSIDLQILASDHDFGVSAGRKAISCLSAFSVRKPFRRRNTQSVTVRHGNLMRSNARFNLAE